MNKEEKTKKETLICVYGSLRKNNGNHRIIENAELKGTFTTLPIYSLYHLGGFPGLKENGKTAIVMEVYSVNEEEARRVDGLEGYSPNRPATFYDKINIDTPWGKAGVYTYVGHIDESRLIETGDWMNQQKAVIEV